LDDDDFSDHDSHYSEDFEDCDFEIEAKREKVPDITQRLLNFAEMVNQDILKFFGRKKDEESCDIYEDKASGSNGRLIIVFRTSLRCGDIRDP
jgi:hypothetical protein